MKQSPYIFNDSFRGHVVDWSGYIGEVVPLLTGHHRPASKEEIARLVASKARECAFFAAMRALRDAGESCEARQMFRQYFGEDPVKSVKVPDSAMFQH